MGQNALGRSNCSIFKSTISLMMKKLDFLACWYKFIEIKSWLKNIEVGMFINGCAHSGCMNLKLALFCEEINERNWLLAC